MARFYAAKIAALLHDPVWKPWIVGRVSGTGRVLAWTTSGKPRGENVDECRGLIKKDLPLSLNAHELDALAAVKSIILDEELRGIVVNEIKNKDSVVHRADRLASSLDRWMLVYSKESRASKTSIPVRDVSYVNPLDPRFRIKARDDVSPDVVCRYVKALKGLFEDMNSLKLPVPLQYNLLYMLLEPLWYSHCRGCIPLADTRTPTHTVFDHVFATASMVNWVREHTPTSMPQALGGKNSSREKDLGAGKESSISGFFVKIDVAGIQKFISASRKVRDLWAGSWLVSALAWATVSDVVKLLGADVVLSPYIGANHFYIASILKELELVIREKGSADKISSNLCKYVKAKEDDMIDCIERLVRDAYLWIGVANQPIAPGTLFLALPCLNEDSKEELLRVLKELKSVDKESLEYLVDVLAKCDAKGVEKYFRERFEKAWRSIVESIIVNIVEEYGGVLDIEYSFRKLVQKLKDAEALAEENTSIENATRYLKEAAEHSPLHIRVLVVDVERAYNDLTKELSNISEARDVIGKLGLGIKEVAEKLLFTYLFSVAMPRLEEEKLARNVSVEPGFKIASILESITRSKYRECTVCSKLPAIVYVRNPDKLSKTLNIPRSFFTPGELLCPYCFYKRLLTLNTVLLRVMDSLGLYVSPRLAGKVYPRPPSTCELASLNALSTFAERLVDEWSRRRLGVILKRLEQVTKAGLSRYSGVANVYQPLRALVWAKCKGEKECAEDVLKVLGFLEDMFDFSCLLIAVRSQRRRVDSCVKFYCGLGGVGQEGAGEEGSGREKCSVFREFCNILFGDEGLLADIDLGTGAYYVIVRGDGDYFGSCVVNGFLGYKDTGEYVGKVLESINNNDVRRIIGEEFTWLAERLTAIASKLSGRNEAPNTLLTPAYYTALSRGQMITAIMDSMLSAILGGFPVYAGGDDVAVLSPSHINEKVLGEVIEYYKKQVAEDDAPAYVAGRLLGLINLQAPRGFVGAEIAYTTRLNYWGLLEPPEFRGFHRTPIGAVYPAPAAYGRSYGILVTHYRDPFQAAWKAAGLLEELKDGIVFRSVDCKYEAWKDAVFIAYGRVASLAGTLFQAVPLPNMVSGDDKSDYSRVAIVLRKAIDLASEVISNNGAVSKSIFADFASECETAEQAALEALNRCDPELARVAISLAEMLAARNARSEGRGEEARRLVKIDALYLVPAAKEGHEEATRIIACSSFLPWLIVYAAKYIVSGMR